MSKILYCLLILMGFLNPCSYAEKTFELQEIRSGNDISNVRKIYPKAKVVYFFFEGKTGIYFSVYEIEKGKKYLFINSEAAVEESSWAMKKNGKPFANKDKSWRPHMVKVYNQITGIHGSEIDKTGFRTQVFGYMLSILPSDTVSFMCRYNDEDKKMLSGYYSSKFGWKISMDRTKKRDERGHERGPERGQSVNCEFE